MAEKPTHRGNEPIVSRYSDDPEMAELVGLFLQELPERLNNLESCWKQAQIKNVARVAHQLKGSGAGYGFPAIGEAAARLEAGLAGLDSGDAGALGRVRTEFDELIDLCRRACGA